MKRKNISTGIRTNKSTGWWMVQVCRCGGSSLIFITLWCTQQSADEPFSRWHRQREGLCVWVRAAETKRGNVTVQHREGRKRGGLRTYRFKLLPRVAPGPIVCFVLSEPHSHQLIPTVIEDWSVQNKERKKKKHFIVCYFSGEYKPFSVTAFI